MSLQRCWWFGAISMIAAVLVAQPSHAQVGPIDFKSRETSDGRNYTQAITASLAVGKSSGQATMTYSFDLPNGRGVGPQLTIDYLSGAGVSEVGAGWALTIPMIERSSKHGVPRFDGADTFHFRNGHSTQELVPTGVLTTDGWTVFRERSERSFSRYLFKNNTWRVLSRDGIRLELGTAPSSRRGLGARDSASNTAAWLLRQIADPHDNSALWTYADGEGQQSLLRHVAYTLNSSMGVTPRYVVNLDWQPFLPTGQERLLSFRRGYREEFGIDRLATVNITAPAFDTTASPAKIPGSSPTSIDYHLEHELSASGDAAYRLESVQVADRPPTIFRYSQPWPTGTMFQTGDFFAAIPSVPGDVFPDVLGLTETEQDDAPRTWTRIAIADVTGDGRADIVDAQLHCDFGLWVVWRNTGEAFQSEHWPQPALPPDASGDRCAIRGTQRLPAATNTFQDLVDFTGDAFPDLAFWDAADMYICRGTGTGFEPCEIWGPLPAGVPPGMFRRDSTPFENVSVTDVDLMDINSDGLVDRVSTLAGSTVIRVVLNDGGEQWGAMQEFTMPPCLFPGVTSCLRLMERILSNSGNRRQVAETRDVNGDGLPDFLTTLRDGTVAVAWGNGRGFEPQVLMPSNPAALGVGRESSGGDYHASIDLVDIDGDGLPDIVETSATDPHRFTIRFNHGGAWDDTVHEYDAGADPPGANHVTPALARQIAVDDKEVETRALLSDATGDGLADLLSVRFSSSGGVASVLVRSLAYRAPRLIEGSSSFSSHRTTGIEYAPMPGALPFPIHVPSRHTIFKEPVHVGETSREFEHVTSYAYDGATYDRAEREFRGFGQVIAAGEIYGTHVTTNYLTGKFSAGLVETEVVANVDGESRPRTVANEYSESTMTLGSVFVRLDRRRVLDGALFDWRVEETLFDDYFYGEARTIVQLGELADATDDVTTERTFAVRNDSDHLIVVPTATRRLRQGFVVANTMDYYDDRVIHGVTPTKGDLVRTRIQRAPFVWVDSHAYYDDFGVMTRYVDPEGIETSYVYDPDYRQFPVQEITAVGTVHRSFHPLTAGSADTCGPQHVAGTWRCGRVQVDVLGRVTSRSVPVLTTAGTFAMALAMTTTYDDFAYPLRVEEMRRPGSADAGRTIAYFDALGNLVQSRTEETAGLFRIADRSNDALGMNQWQAHPRRQSGGAFSSWTNPGVFGTHLSYDHVRGAVERVRHPRDIGAPLPPAVNSRIHLGKEIVFTDEVGRQTVAVLDGFGRTVEQKLVGGVLGDAVTVFGYDANGALSSVRDPNNLVTEYERNLMGWVTGVTLPDGQQYGYLHDRRGELLEVSDPRGFTVHYDYDAAGRPWHVHSTGTPTHVRPIDEETEYYGATHSHKLGWIQSRTADGIEHVFDYDAGGRVAQQRASYAGYSAVVDSRWTFDGRLERVSFPDGWSARFEYYRDDTPRRALDGFTGAVLADSLLHDTGQPSVIASDYGLEEHFDYDARQRATRITSLNVNVGAEPLVDDEVTWTDASEVRDVVRHGMAPGGVPRTAPDTYVNAHDSLGRLDTVTRNGNGYADYAYDLGARLTSFAEIGDEYSYVYSHDQMVKRFSSTFNADYDYDRAGNVVASSLDGPGISGHKRTLEWDALNRLASLRIEPRAGGIDETAYYYLGDTLAMVAGPAGLPMSAETLHVGDWLRYDLLGEEYTQRIWLGSRLVLERRSGLIEFPHRTIGSTVAAVTNTSGDILMQEEFLPYGVSEVRSGAAEHENAYHGLRRDELIVAGSRAYDAAAGRWLARDPLQLVPEEFAAMKQYDSYSYAFSNPFRYRDPSGLNPKEIFDMATGFRCLFGACDAATYVTHRPLMTDAEFDYFTTHTLPIWYGEGVAAGMALGLSAFMLGNPAARSVVMSYLRYGGPVPGSSLGPQRAPNASGAPSPSARAGASLTKSEVAGLRQLFGQRDSGATALLNRLADGERVQLPKGVTRETLLKYHDIAQQAIDGPKGDPVGTQALRVKVIEQLLKQQP